MIPLATPLAHGVPSMRGRATVPDAAAARAERELVTQPLRPGPLVTAPGHAVHSPVTPGAPAPTGEPPSGGDAPTLTPRVGTSPGRVAPAPLPLSGGERSASRARSATTRLAPAPIRFAARTAVLAVFVIGIHAAASHPLTALAAAVLLLIAACAPSPRR